MSIPPIVAQEEALVRVGVSPLWIAAIWAAILAFTLFKPRGISRFRSILRTVGLLMLGAAITHSILFNIENHPLSYSLLLIHQLARTMAVAILVSSLFFQ